MIRPLLTACAASLLAASALSSAAAADRTTIVTGTVKVSDLNLSTGQGAQTLLRRAKVRFHDLCAQVDSPLDPGASQAEQACVGKAMANLVREVNTPAVTAEYGRQSGQVITLAGVR
jgi:UrcA family protein